jgi:hypothetical protein
MRFLLAECRDEKTIPASHQTGGEKRMNANTKSRPSGQDNVVGFPGQIVVDDYFGGCPSCGRNDGCLNVYKDHWFICHKHKMRWSPGSNLFSGWREETEATWAANDALLSGYHEVTPIMVGVWPKDEKARSRAQAEYDFDKAWAERNRRPCIDEQCEDATAAIGELPI